MFADNMKIASVSIRFVIGSSVANRQFGLVAYAERQSATHTTTVSQGVSEY